ncbi:MAG: 30S ribosomal protein S13 [Mycoplasmataceae bacterium]|jgi:small subunit ribosomal protein S13|nr:30S ribosomal protein S13 [Mycoplasmataceae bacterium]
MPRILGVDIPMQKQIAYSLTAIYGIGISRARKVCKLANVDPTKRTKLIDENEISSIRNAILKLEYVIEGDLRRDIAMAIKREININSYVGVRHKRGLPVRGQRTKTNARTRKGPRKTVAKKKVETK